MLFKPGAWSRVANSIRVSSVSCIIFKHPIFKDYKGVLKILQLMEEFPNPQERHEDCAKR
jgi:hypothetical protein